MIHQVSTIQQRMRGKFEIHDVVNGESKYSNQEQQQRFDENGRKVIKAVNQNILTNTTMIPSSNIHEMKKRMENIELEQKAAIKGLKNLEILHSDTFKVCIQKASNQTEIFHR